MSKVNDGGPAFPYTQVTWQRYSDELGYAKTREVTGISGGMTLRDYFAAKAMNAGIVFDMPRTEIGVRACAAFAYQMADAMLKAREVKP